MEIEDIYRSIIRRPSIWNYYNKNVSISNILDTTDCYQFIKNYIQFAEKAHNTFNAGLVYLYNSNPNRLSHIASTFFLGLWMLNHRESWFLYESIAEKLCELGCLCNNQDEIKRHLTFVWFMATFYHDLGYKAEDTENGKKINKCIRLQYINNSVPYFYVNNYKTYYSYRENREHGIYGGINFYDCLCKIRQIQCCNSSSNLIWDKSLEELYNYVAWIILAHNIWLVDRNSENALKYKDKELDELVLESGKDENGIYKEYKVKFEEYPLFVFFCIIDTIEPLKSTSCLSRIEIELIQDKIVIESNDSEYRKKALGLRDWLLPAIEKSNCVTIFLTYEAYKKSLQE